MTVSYAALAKNAQLDALTTHLGSTPIIRIYSGTPPATADTGLSGNTLLAELTMSATPFPAASSGAMTANAITSDSSADNTGTATFFRILTSGGTAKVQGSVGTSGSDLNLNSTSIVAGTTVAISSLVITGGN